MGMDLNLHEEEYEDEALKALLTSEEIRIQILENENKELKKLFQDFKKELVEATSLYLGGGYLINVGEINGVYNKFAKKIGLQEVIGATKM